MTRGSSHPVMGALALAACLAGGATALAQAPPSAPSAGLGTGGQLNITIIAEERDLRSVVREIDRKAGVNIYVDPGIEEVISVRLVNAPWRQVLEVVARDAGVEVEERGPRLFILTQPPRVFMEFADADIRAVLDLLARQAGKNVVIANDVTGTVSLNLRNVHWWRALDTIVKTAGYVAVQDEEGGDLIRIVRPETLKAQLSTRVYPLIYLRPPDDYFAVITDRSSTDDGAGAGQLFEKKAGAEDLQGFTLLTALQKMISAESQESIEYNRESNSFIVKATATKHADIEALLKKIDLEPEQVFVDVKFITTTNKNFWGAGLRSVDPANNDQSVGFLANLIMNGATPLNEAGVAGTDAGASLGQFPFVFGNGVEFSNFINIPAILDFSQMQLIAQYTEVDTNSKVTQAPTLLSLDGKPAVIFVGEKVPFAEQEANVDQNGTVTVTLEESDKSPQDVGFTLFVTPHIVRDTDKIIMTIIPRVTRLTGVGSDVAGLERFEFVDPTTGTATFIDLPRVFDQTVVTSLLVHDGQTAVIGGLMQESIFEIEERIPILSALPLIGPLFTFESKDYKVENQIIFVTPTIVRTPENGAELFKRQYQIFQETDFFHQKYLKEENVKRPRRAKGKKTPSDVGMPTGAGEPLGPDGGQPAEYGEPSGELAPVGEAAAAEEAPAEELPAEPAPAEVPSGEEPAPADDSSEPDADGGEPIEPLSPEAPPPSDG